MSYVGLDLNATRVLAVSGQTGSPPRLLSLDSPHGELPLVLSLEHRHVEVGRAGKALCRVSPHLVCQSFLPKLGDNKHWSGGRHRLDAAKALGFVWEQLRQPFLGADGIGLALPSYLSTSQVNLLTKSADKIKVPVLGSAIAPLALSLSAHFEQPWTGVAITADIDDHALAFTAVVAGADHLQVASERLLPRLGLTAWKSRLIDAVAERCVRHSRRDPRDSATSEQMLFEQVEPVWDNCRRGQLSDLKIEAPHWYQNVLLGADEIVKFYAPLLKQALEGFKAVLAAPAVAEPPQILLLSQTVARLPGLLSALKDACPPTTKPHVLAVEATARGAFLLACRWAQGDLARGHFDTLLPLPHRRGSEAIGDFLKWGPMLRTGF